MNGAVARGLAAVGDAVVDEEPRRGGRRAKVLRVATRTVLVIALLLTVLCVFLGVATFKNDRSIEGDLGVANAEVVSVTFDRSLVRYQTPDGIVHLPLNGVLYPQGLRQGQVIRIEYDGGNPELARVAGRTARLAVLPLSTTILGVWVVAGGLLWWLRRKAR